MALVAKKTVCIELDIHSRELLLSGEFQGWETVSVERAAEGAHTTVSLLLDSVQSVVEGADVPRLLTFVSSWVTRIRPNVFRVQGLLATPRGAPRNAELLVDAESASSGLIGISWKAQAADWDEEWWREILEDVSTDGMAGPAMPVVLAPRLPVV